MLDIGDPLPDLAVEIHDGNGDLANADVVTLTVTLPDETTASPTVTNPSTGRYEAAYIPEQAGRHVVRWVATGVNAAAYTDVYDVREAEPPFIVSLDDAKTHLNITSTTNDEELRGWIEAATSVVEWKVGAVVIRSHVERHNSGPVLVLWRTPVLSVTSVAPWLTTGTTYDPIDLKVNPDTGIVERKDGGEFTGGPFGVTYKAGRRVVPANMTQAAKIIIQHLWETQRGGSRRPGMGGDDLVVTPMGFAIPNRAIELLGPDKRAPAVA